jgi:glycosyltransferase involved in cell wall biosynthesis
MHIILLHQMFNLPDQPGGMRHYELARGVAQRGHQVSIVASDLSYKTGKRIVDHRGLVSVQELEGMRIMRAYTYPSLHRSFAWRMVSFVSFMLTSMVAALRAGAADLVMSTSPPIFQAVSAWVVALMRRCPFLLEIRDLWPAFAIDIGLLANPVMIALSRGLESFLYARAAHIMVNSPAYQDYLLEKGIASSKITLIPNGADIDLFDPTTSGESIRRQWKLDGKFVVTYAGALGLANDLPTILRAAQRLRAQPDIHFLVVGDGKERTNLETLADELDLPNLTFTGSVVKAELPSVLAASDVCVATLKDIPMFRTTYPNKVFDYMAAGRATILAIDGVIRQVVEAAGGGIFVPPGDDAAMAKVVQRLSQDRQLVQSMGCSARDYVVEHFDRRQHAAQFAELAARLVEKAESSNA